MRHHHHDGRQIFEKSLKSDEEKTLGRRVQSSQTENENEEKESKLLEKIGKTIEEKGGENKKV